jgi:phosphate/sulfate permease
MVIKWKEIYDTLDAIALVFPYDAQKRMGNHRKPDGGHPGGIRQETGFLRHFCLSSADHIPVWIVLAAHAAIAGGTATAGWRIVKTMGVRITKLRPFVGFWPRPRGESRCCWHHTWVSR